jgi:hypothetical protein
MRATEACKADPHHGAESAYYVAGTEPTEECDVHYLLKICPDSHKLATPYCENYDTLEGKSYVVLKPDSIYWLFRSDEERMEYMPNLMAAPASGTPLSEIMADSSSPEYYQFFCDIHNESWWQERNYRANAVNVANTQIAASSSVLSNPSYVMSLEDKTSLSTKINELQQLIADAASTSGAIEQKTSELESLTNRLVALYTPVPTQAPLP